MTHIGSRSANTAAARIRRAAPPVLVYLALRLVGVAVLAAMSAVHDASLFDRMTAWDGQWYLGIAEHGYAGHGEFSLDIDGEPYPDAPYAFFPMYPAAMSIVATFGISLDAAGLVVSTLAGVAAVPAVMRIAGHVDPRRRVGLLLVALWAGAPMSGVLSMVYTEATFTALALWALVGVLERRWLLAGGCTLAAGLTRSSAAVLIVIVVVAALHAAWTRRDRWRAAAGAMLAPLGLLGWWLAVYLATGHTWQEIQLRGWGVSWDWGVDTLDWITGAFGGEVHPYDLIGAAVTVGAAVLAAVLAARPAPWPLTAFAAGSVVLAAGSGGLVISTPRLLLVAVPVLLLPVAAGLADRRTGTALVVTGVAAAAGCWFSAYALTVWPYAI
ncbi:hypothetical protein [Prauserella alba]|uniref:Membrane protein n=1 Tax=Prauserella alba TaxID=176898 RepID=A0ABN1VMA5_9PSEU|nr:hypothetical protein [Prauserella alba]MCP2180856.1 hypothetical protein [Prauserella alba]